MDDAMSETSAMFNLLRQSADPAVAEAIERFVAEAPDHMLVRLNALAFAASHQLNEELVIAAFLHASKIGIFDISWNVLCPDCGGVLDSNATLKTVRNDEYFCATCDSNYQPDLDELVEVTFTVSPRVRPIAAHHPDQLSAPEYLRQVHYGSLLDLPSNFEEIFEEITLEALDSFPPACSFWPIR